MLAAAHSQTGDPQRPVQFQPGQPSWRFVFGSGEERYPAVIGGGLSLGLEGSGKTWAHLNNSIGFHAISGAEGVL